MKEKEVQVKKKKGSFYSRMAYSNKRTLWGIIFLIPWAFGLIFFFLGPLIKTFYYSFFDLTMVSGGFEYVFTGFTNFKYALTVNPTFNQDLLTALIQAGQNVPIQIFVSLFIAMLLNGKFKGRGMFRTIYFIPIILATGITNIDLTGVSSVEEFSTSFVNTGAIVSLLSTGGIPSNLLNMLVSFADSIFEVVTIAGVQMLIFLAGLQAISPTLYEVAKIEGCSAFECFCKITLPMISPMILVCLVYSLADTFANSDISDTISTITFTNAKYGLGAAMSAIYFLVSMAVILIVSLIVSKVVFYYDN